MRTYLHPLSRALVALIFIISGIGKLVGFAGTKAMMAGVGFPVATFFLVAAIIIELIGGALLLIGYQTRGAALALIIFLIPATLIFHAAHLGDPAQGQMQMIEVLKNLAILGGLVKFAADGAGRFALDNARASGSAPHPIGA